MDGAGGLRVLVKGLESRNLASLVALLALVVFGVLLPGFSRLAKVAVTPSGFVDQKVPTVAAPTAIAFTPDGQMRFAEDATHKGVKSRAVLLGVKR